MIDPKVRPRFGHSERRVPGGYRVTLGKSGNPFSDPSARFLLAHEIAHCVIDLQIPISPSSRSEYWRLEELCNEMAAQLLVPRSFLHASVPGLRDGGANGGEALRAMSHVALSGNVSVEVAGKRIARVSTDGGRPLYLAVLEWGTKSVRGSAGVRESALRVLWSSDSTWGPGPRSLLGSGHFIRRALELAASRQRPPADAIAFDSAHIWTQAVGVGRWGVAVLPSPDQSVEVPAPTDQPGGDSTIADADG